MELPILINHDHSKPIGFASEIDGKLFVEFIADIKIKKICLAGLRILDATEEGGVFIIRKAEILELSLRP